MESGEFRRIFAAGDSGYEYISTTADIGISIHAPNLSELFRQAGRALFSLMSDLSRVRATERFDVSLSAESIDDLLITWLNHLVYLYDVHCVFLSDFMVTFTGETTISAVATGEPIDPDRHRFDMEIKAATYHRLSVEERVDGWWATVILDV
jgi:SHS2 domain-containing protein